MRRPVTAMPGEARGVSLAEICREVLAPRLLVLTTSVGAQAQPPVGIRIAGARPGGCETGATAGMAGIGNVSD